MNEDQEQEGHRRKTTVVSGVLAGIVVVCCAGIVFSECVYVPAVHDVMVYLMLWPVYGIMIALALSATVMAIRGWRSTRHASKAPVAPKRLLRGFVVMSAVTIVVEIVIGVTWYSISTGLQKADSEQAVAILEQRYGDQGWEGHWNVVFEDVEGARGTEVWDTNIDGTHDWCSVYLYSDGHATEDYWSSLVWCRHYEIAIALHDGGYNPYEESLDDTNGIDGVYDVTLANMDEADLLAHRIVAANKAADLPPIIDESSDVETMGQSGIRVTVPNGGTCFISFVDRDHDLDFDNVLHQILNAESLDQAESLG